MKNTLGVRKMTATDWKAVATIYAEGIATSIATFETKVPTYSTWNKSHMQNCRIVAIYNKLVIGWAALSPVSSRCVYEGVAEVSIYVASNYRGMGVGKLLMKNLIATSESIGIWTLQSGIFTDNKSSIELHKKAGFRYIGKRERVGKLNGEWKDNLLFEKRSKLIGI